MLALVGFVAVRPVDLRVDNLRFVVVCSLDSPQSWVIECCDVDVIDFTDNDYCNEVTKAGSDILAPNYHHTVQTLHE